MGSYFGAGAPPNLLYFGGDGMFTGGTIWLWTHGHALSMCLHPGVKCVASFCHATTATALPSSLAFTSLSFSRPDLISFAFRAGLQATSTRSSSSKQQRASQWKNQAGPLHRTGRPSIKLGTGKSTGGFKNDEDASRSCTRLLANEHGVIPNGVKPFEDADHSVWHERTCWALQSGSNLCRHFTLYCSCFERGLKKNHQICLDSSATWRQNYTASA